MNEAQNYLLEILNNNNIKLCIVEEIKEIHDPKRLTSILAYIKAMKNK